MKQLDVLLVLGYFRSAAAYLAVARHLASTHRVGIMPAEVDPAWMKSPELHAAFLALCASFGAEIIPQGTRVQTRLMIVQQFPYPQATADAIDETVTAGARVALMGLTLAGVRYQDEFLTQFRLKKGFVINRRLLDFVIDNRGVGELYADVEFRQVGLPYRKYPVFPDFHADYIIAAPTAFSFRQERHKHQFFSAVLRLLDQVPRSAEVVYKAHNALARDYFTPRAYATPGAILSRVPGVPALLSALIGLAPQRARTHLERLLTSVLHAQVLRRAIPLSAKTPHADFALEAFLPGLRGGVIGGLSNTIWGTLYFGLPYYNCVDEEERNKSARNELLPHKDSSNYLDLNLEFFRVPYCEGELSNPARGETIVTPRDREGDLIEEIRAELGELPAVAASA
jgi:hypothetical protein